MKRKSIIIITITLFLSIIVSTQFSCNRKSDELIVVPEYLEVSFPLLTFNYDEYYSIDQGARSIEVVFNHNIDDETVSGNFFLKDKNGSLESNYDIFIEGKIIFIRFNNNYYLRDGWKYDLSISNGLRSIEGLSVNYEEVIEFRTTAVNEPVGLSGGPSDTTRTIIAVISDIHCGDERATNGNYSWFGKNADALVDFLKYIKTNAKVKELVILGDLFDEWMVPYNYLPFDPSVNINNSSDYFHAIANSSVNKPIFDQLNEISTGGEIQVIYVPGNHDMLITQDVIEELIPNAIWKSDVTGVGIYNPVDEIVMEHGHRYDFFNCPQPLVNDGQILPPGYFITRLYAAGLANRTTGKLKVIQDVKSDIEFVTAWSVALGYTIADFSMKADTIHMDSSNILMTGIDNYFTNMSFNGARDMYDANIEELWHSTQEVNNVPNTLSVFLAILNGTYLYGAALFEYLTDYFAPHKPKIVAFGHSHEPELKMFPIENAYTGIYANSGSWIDADQSKYDTRTYLMISPAAWTGSELDVVSLYQYNLDNDSGSNYKPVLLKEESIHNK